LYFGFKGRTPVDIIIVVDIVRNLRMVRVGGDLKDHLVPTTPAMSRDIFH